MRRIYVLVLTIAIASCAQTPPRAGEIAASPSPGARAGVLAGDARLEGGCVWLDTGGERLEVLWPQGYRADVDPIELRDPSGAVIAMEGDRLAVEGAPATEQLSACQTGALWEATGVTPVN
jgi:hypothetical protein